MKRIKKSISILTIVMLVTALVTGCGRSVEEGANGSASSENIIITETGEILVKPQPTEKAELPIEKEEPVEETKPQEMSAPEIDLSEIQLEEPEQEQVITEEDQTEPTGSELQIVFLGDSIFDNNRDGTGIPYLTSVQCKADVYNLAIAGTSATLELGESAENEKWTSRSLVGIVKAMEGKISTDVFGDTRAKEILDKPKVDFSQTDYFVVEYGINDFFRAVPRGGSDNDYDVFTYSGALRYAVSNLSEFAPDATIILCGPHYCQFFHDGRFIGDGNVLNTGYGTLFDYAGTCQYVAKEQQAEFFNAYLDLGIDGYTAEEYLEDGVHLTAAGRQLYADALAEMILKLEETKNN